MGFETQPVVCFGTPGQHQTHTCSLSVKMRVCFRKRNRNLNLFNVYTFVKKKVIKVYIPLALKWSTFCTFNLSLLYGNVDVDLVSRSLLSE